jgi:hypothetical protein
MLRESCKLLLFLAVISPLISLAQNNVGIGTSTPDSSAILHLQSTDKGFLPPRMSTAERDAIVNPKGGLQIFNTTDSIMQYFNGFCWLHTYQENCTDCYFSMSLSDSSGTIDRVVADSVNTTLTINQISGTAQNITISVSGNFPTGFSYQINNNPIPSSGTATITFKVSTFTPAGTYPIIIQGLCNPSIKTIIYLLTVEPCYELFVNNSINNYSISADLYATYPTAPTNSPVCVIATVAMGVNVSSTSVTQPAFTIGTLPTGSVVAIINNGQIMGRGGNGGVAEDPSANPPLSGAGVKGGDAINLTEKTQILNNGYIFGGGGGGSAMAFKIGLPVGPIYFGALIGSGGGGGAGLSLGGASPNVIGISYYSPGQNGTGGLFGVPGMGGILNFPINYTQGPVSITLNPNAIGGNGGFYGYPGIQGNFSLTLSAAAIVNIPFVGPVSVPIFTNLNIPVPVTAPLPGGAGFAVKRNGFNVNILDNSYNTSFLKGIVGN